MTKSALAATSLVAAVPGGFMAFLTVKAFLDHANDMPTMLMAVTGTALAFSALMALSPVGILLFSKGAPKPDKEKKEEPGLAETAAVTTVPARDSKSKEEANETGFTPAEDFETEEGSDAVGAESEETMLSSGEDSEFELEDDAFEFDDEDSK